ncbi:hypothetical protein RQP46_007527 [Phenoliferia psychrophenolica]
MDDEDEQFLYGDEDDEPTNAYSAAPSQPPTTNGTPAVSEPEDEGNGAEEEDGDDESDDDFEIIVDADPSAPAPPPPVRRPVVAARPPVAAPVKAVDSPAVEGESSTDSPAPEASSSSSLALPLPSGLVPHGSLTPFGVGAAPLAAETHPNLDVDIVHKDKDGNDLFDLDIDAIEDKSWRKPGANMADYFNYGMNEPAWKNYARKQRITRQAESAEKNPFAAFASGNLQESWQSLAPEFKAVMMATIMGYQPGMNPQQAQQGMMGMMNGMGGMGAGGMNGMGAYGMGQQQMGGYNAYGQQYPGALAAQQQAAMNGGGMNYAQQQAALQAQAQAKGFASPRAPLPPAPEGADASADKGLGEEDAMPKVEEGLDGDVDMAQFGADGVLGIDGFNPAAFGAPTGPGMGRGRGGVVPRGAAAFAARGGRGGAQVAGVPRALSPLPVGVPTGPRNPGPTSAPRRDRSGYQDKDRQLPPGNDGGLDYGGGSGSGSKDKAKDDSSPVRSRRESLPPRARSPETDSRRSSTSKRSTGEGRSGSDRRTTSERPHTRDRSDPRDRSERGDKDRSDRDREREREDKEYDRQKDKERERERDKPRAERERTKTPERPKPRRDSAGVSDMFPGAPAVVAKDAPSAAPPVVALKIRGVTKKGDDAPAPPSGPRGDRELPTGPAADESRSGSRRGESEGGRSHRRGGSGDDASTSSRRPSHRGEPDLDDASERRRSRTSRQDEEVDEEARTAARRSRRHHWDDDDAAANDDGAAR